MLAPADRRLLFELLRPPAGYRLSCAVGTTYSLDLLARLVTPLAFTLFDWETKEGRLTASPLALLESLRRYTDKMTIFCQAGGIHPPGKSRQLFGYLEQSIVEVSPKRRGVFHAKLWLLRFEPHGQPLSDEWPIQYRLLCPSRNLTFDRSWDTMLALEGTFIPRGRKEPQNEPLIRFLSLLPELSVREQATGKAREHVELLSQELPRVRFDPPEGFREVYFWPLGLDDATSLPFTEGIDRLLVISPFVTESMLKKLADISPVSIISRSEELARISASTLERLTARYTLDPAAEADAQLPASVELDEEESVTPTANNGSGDATPQPISADKTLSGLHAKVYVADQNGIGRIWTGSANATDAAFSGNVEILIELTGKQEV
jgi:hypothetical protein